MNNKAELLCEGESFNPRKPSQPSQAKFAGKKTMSLVEALRWAYREELPKDKTPLRVGPQRAASAAQRLGRVAELGVMVDENRYGLVADLAASDEPHPDAIRLHGMVMAIGEELVIGLPEGFDLIPELDDPALAIDEICRSEIASRLLPKVSCLDEAGFRNFIANPGFLLRRLALLGAPDWQFDMPEICYVMAANGTPKWFRKHVQPYDCTVSGERRYVEVETEDGYDRKRKRPHEGAYTKRYLEPDPVMCGQARADYVVMVAGLLALFDRVYADPLHNISVSGIGLDERPWIGEARADPRVLHCLHQAER